MYSCKSCNKIYCMNKEPLVLPGTCGLFLGTGGAGPRALRFSAVPGKGAHVHAYNLAICHIPNFRVCTYIELQSESKQKMKASKVVCNLLYNLHSCK